MSNRNYNRNYKKDEATGLTLYQPTDPKAKGTKQAKWRLVFPDPVTGRPKTRWASSRDHALRRFRELNDWLEVGVSAPADRDRMTFAQLVDEYLKAEHTDDWSFRVRRNSTYHCRTLASDAMHLGHRRLNELVAEPRIIEQAFRKLAKEPRGRTGRPLATSTLKVTRGYLSTLFEFARYARYIPPSADPMGAVKWPGRRRGASTTVQGQSERYVPMERIPTDDAIDRLCDVWVERAVGDQWWRALDVRLAATAGMRWGEQHALRPVDVSLNLDEPVITVHRQVTFDESYRSLTAVPKMRKTRITVYPPHLHGALARRCREVEDTDGPYGLLFPAPRGGLAVYKNFRESFVRMARTAGWKTDPATGRLVWTWHSLRHRAATYMLYDLGFDLSMVSHYLGHETERYTMERYVQLRPDNVAKAVDLFRKHRRDDDPDGPAGLAAAV